MSRSISATTGVLVPTECRQSACLRNRNNRFNLNLSFSFARRGRAGQPGPRAENRERGQPEPRWKSPPSPISAMTGESTNSQKQQLALAIAEGTSVAQWASQNGVVERTAYHWAAQPDVRAEVESIRRRALDEAIGRMAKHASKAVEGIVNLAQHANSESVRLSALRAVMSDFVAVSNFAGLEARVGELEAQLLGRTETTETEDAS